MNELNLHGKNEQISLAKRRLNHKVISIIALILTVIGVYNYALNTTYMTTGLMISLLETSYLVFVAIIVCINTFINSIVYPTSLRVENDDIIIRILILEFRFFNHSLMVDKSTGILKKELVEKFNTSNPVILLLKSNQTGRLISLVVDEEKIKVLEEDNSSEATN